jgi:hypothetical protein
MRPRSLRSGLLAATLSLSGAFAATPVAASCIPLPDMLPEPLTPGAVVFVGTVVSSDELTTDLTVERWYLGEARAVVQVVGGREPDAITSVEWTPSIGDRYVVVAQVVDETLVTGTCMQSMPYPELLDELAFTYGEPEVPPAGVDGPPPSPSPVVTSNESPLPGSLVHGTPEPTVPA